MSLKIGIVGLPNVGKSTLFNALMKRAAAQAANHPFTTIEPNIGIVDVPDKRLQRLYDIVVNSKHQAPNSKPAFAKATAGGQILNSNDLNPKIIPATVEFIDIAGIIAGAHKGEGLGNQFLTHIREADAIAIVIRCFTDDSIIHVAGKVNPLEDTKTVLLELILADLATLQRKLDTSKGNTGGKTSDEIAKQRVHRLLTTALENEQLASSVKLNDDERALTKEFQLLTVKPLLYVANVSEQDAGKSAEEIIEEWNFAEFLAKNPPTPPTSTSEGRSSDRSVGAATVIPISAKVEAEVSELEETEAKEYLGSLGLSEPGLNRLIRSGYDLLGLTTFFTAGPKEVRAWTFKKGWKAPECAGVIHGDFEKGFIRAEVISFEDYIAYSGEQEAKAAGKLRSEGKEYMVKDGDVVHFRFNV